MCKSCPRRQEASGQSRRCCQYNIRGGTCILILQEAFLDFLIEVIGSYHLVTVKMSDVRTTNCRCVPDSVSIYHLAHIGFDKNKITIQLFLRMSGLARQPLQYIRSNDQPWNNSEAQLNW
jgi:hypothetical protein